MKNSDRVNCVKCGKSFRFTHKCPLEFQEKQSTQQHTPNEMRHTPTPWQTSELYLLDNNGDTIGKLNTGDGREQALVDAAYIVRAVNAHEELLSELKDALAEFQRIGYKDLERIKKAIAKAEGKE